PPDALRPGQPISPIVESPMSTRKQQNCPASTPAPQARPAPSPHAQRPAPPRAPQAPPHAPASAPLPAAPTPHAHPPPHHAADARAASAVRQFPAHTPSLRQLVAWLQECAITTVAPEASGVYGHVLFLTLLEAGFHVLMTSPKFTRQIQGRPKTDKRDCPWI